MGDRTVFIYALELEGGKYYIGRTTNPGARIGAHFGGRGSAWTHKYKPIREIERAEGTKFDEDWLVLVYMDKHGVDNVRGGTFSQVSLDAGTRKHIEAMLTNANDRCFRCNEAGHFAADCRAASATQLAEPLTPMLPLAPKLSFWDTIAQAVGRLFSWTAIASCTGQESYQAIPPETTPTPAPGSYGSVASAPLPAFVDDLPSNPEKKAEAVAPPSPVRAPLKAVCHRCGHTGHTVQMCWARKHMSGETLGKRSAQTLLSKEEIQDFFDSTGSD